MRPEVTMSEIAPTRRSVLMFASGAFVASFFTGAHAALAQDAKPIKTLQAQEAFDAAQSGEIILVDIRTPEEWRETRVGEGAIGLDMRTEEFVNSLVTLRKANPDTPIALICRTGARSAYVTAALAGQGFPGLMDVPEGMVGGRNGQGWLKRGLPTYEGTTNNIDARRNAILP